MAAFQLALLVRTREHLSPQWARTENNLAETYWALKDWPNAAKSYANVLEIYPDYQVAYQRASVLSHEVLFKFPEAFALDQTWLKQHPNDLSASVEFTEKHFTTGRFVECEQRIGPLLDNPEVELRIKSALQAIEIANLLALGKAQSVPDRLEKLREGIATQPEDFTLGWSFDGTTHFISQSEVLAAYRSWLLQLFTALGCDPQK